MSGGWLRNAGVDDGSSMGEGSDDAVGDDGSMEENGNGYDVTSLLPHGSGDVDPTLRQPSDTNQRQPSVNGNLQQPLATFGQPVIQQQPAKAT